MESQNILEKIGNLIAQNELEKAIKSLHPLLKGSSKLKNLILQSARYNDIMEQIMNGTVSFEDAEITKNKIRFALIDMTSVLEEGAKDDPQIKKEIERLEEKNEKGISIKDSKNINTGTIQAGGDVHLGDKNEGQNAEKIYNIDKINKADFN